MVKRTKKPGKIINEKLLEWDEGIMLPVYFQKPIHFEIYNKHEFGYNPEELDEIFEGVIIVDSVGENKGSWKIMKNNKTKLVIRTAPEHIFFCFDEFLQGNWTPE